MSAHPSAAVIVLCLSLVLAACSSKEGQSEGVATTPLHRKPLKTLQPADPTADMALAVAENKKDDVRVKYDLNRKPQAGQPLEIDVAFIFDADSKGATVTFTGMPGLQVSDQSEHLIAPLKAGQSERHKLAVTPTENGIYYVSATVKANSSLGAVAHTFWIPMVVSAPAALPSAMTPATASSASSP